MLYLPHAYVVLTVRRNLVKAVCTQMNIIPETRCVP